jgi:hypothetical protein
MSYTQIGRRTSRGSSVGYFPLVAVFQVTGPSHMPIDSIVNILIEMIVSNGKVSGEFPGGAPSLPALQCKIASIEVLFWKYPVLQVILV